MVMGLPRESNFKEIRSKSKSVYENAVSGLNYSATAWSYLSAPGVSVKAEALGMVN